MTHAADAIEVIEWDTRFFGQKIARLRPGASVPAQQELDAFCRDQQIAMVQACVGTEDTGSIFALEQCGFHFVDIKVTLGCPTARAAAPAGTQTVYRSTEADIPQLESISDKSYLPVSRFNWRNAFPEEKINAFYTLWMVNGVKGLHDDFCLHYAQNGTIRGFITIKLRDGCAYAGLMAVDPMCRGQGIADILVDAMVRHAQQQSIVNVGTVVLGKNLPTQNLYIKHGLRIKKLESWYYRLTGQGS